MRYVINLNDTVVSIEPAQRYKQKGIIVEIEDDPLFPYLVEFEDGVRLWMSDTEVEPIFKLTP